MRDVRNKISTVGAMPLVDQRTDLTPIDDARVGAGAFVYLVLTVAAQTRAQRICTAACIA